MEAFVRARSVALDALGGDVASRVAAYYRVEGNFAGALFLAAEPNEPERVTAADLFAVTLLNADVGPRTARRVLNDDQLGSALRTVPVDVSLEDADDAILDRAGRCYETVKRLFVDPAAHQSDPWVAPAKLVARKRPRLLPVRDATVRRLLRIERPYRYRTDWEIFRRLMRDAEVRGLLDAVRASLAISDPPLRVLDVALWTKARQ